jgi:hypothetical protein
VVPRCGTAARPAPSDQILGALARGLRLSLEERDHLFRLAGYATPRRSADSDHINPGMRRIFDGLADSSAHVASHLGETLLQTRLSVAVPGDESVHSGLKRWFTDTATRLLHPGQDRRRPWRQGAAPDCGEHAGAVVGDYRAVIAAVGEGDPAQLDEGEDLRPGDQFPSINASVEARLTPDQRAHGPSTLGGTRHAPPLTRSQVRRGTRRGEHAGLSRCCRSRTGHR